MGSQIAQVFAIAIGLLIARLTFDLASAAVYVYPWIDLSVSAMAFAIFMVSVLAALILALVRLFQRRLIEGIALLIACCIPFSFNDSIDREFWKFRIHRSEYLAAVQADPDQPPKFRVFNWGNQNTQLWGGGYIIESIVYDESGEIGHGPEARSPDWIKRQANLPPEVRWINESTHPSCKRRTKSFGAHFYYVSEEC